MNKATHLYMPRIINNFKDPIKVNPQPTTDRTKVPSYTDRLFIQPQQTFWDKFQNILNIILN